MLNLQARIRFHRLACLLIAGSILISLSGCSPNDKAAGPDQSQTERREVTLKVLVIDDPKIAKAAKRRWSAEGLGDALISEMSQEEFSAADFQLNDVDVVIYPSMMQPELLSRYQLMAIPKSVVDGEVVGKNELLPHQRKILMRYGDDIWGLPLGETQLMLVYDKKLFAELKLKAPQTWQEYETVAKALMAEGHLIAEPTSNGWAAKTLLSRVAAAIRVQGELATVFEIESMKPLIATEPFVQSLGQMKSSADWSSVTEKGYDPKAIFQELVQGKIAMGLTWPSNAFMVADATENASDEEKPVSNEDLAVVRLPGSRSWFDHRDAKWERRDENESIHVDVIGGSGRWASVNKTSENGTVALEFAAWISSKPTSMKVSIESPNVSIYRATHLGQPARWTGEFVSAAAADQVSNIVDEIGHAGIVFLFPRIKGQAEYMAELDAAVMKALIGADAESALQNAFKKWEAITDREGRDEQRSMLRRSEGFSG